MGHASFDIIAMPNHYAYHDFHNVIRTCGIVHNVTPAELNPLKKAAPRLKAPLKALVLIGGDSVQIPGETNEGILDSESACKIAKLIRKHAKPLSMGLFISNSHRTSRSAWSSFLNEVEDLNHAAYDFHIDQGRNNPYLPMLAAADYVIVTADSMSMCCEACSTGKPVFLAGLNYDFIRSDHRRLAEELISKGYAKPLEEFHPDWKPEVCLPDAGGFIALKARSMEQARITARYIPQLRTRSISYGLSA